MITTSTNARTTNAIGLDTSALLITLLFARDLERVIDALDLAHLLARHAGDDGAIVTFWELSQRAHSEVERRGCLRVVDAMSTGGSS